MTSLLFPVFSIVVMPSAKKFFDLEREIRCAEQCLNDVVRCAFERDDHVIAAHLRRNRSARRHLQRVINAEIREFAGALERDLV